MRVALHLKFVQLLKLQLTLLSPYTMMHSLVALAECIGNLEEVTAVRKAIALLRQAIRLSPGENTGTAKLESIRGVNASTEASGSKPRSNTKKNRILPAKKENKKEVEGSRSGKPKGKLSRYNRFEKTKARFGKATGKIFANVGYQWRSHRQEVAVLSWVMGLCYWFDSVILKSLYYVEGLAHNLFSVGQFYDSDLEVAFRKHTCFVRDINGADILKGSRSTNLHTISIDEMMKSSPICAPSCQNHGFCGLSRVGLNKTVRFIRTDNGTEFVNQVMSEYYEGVGIFYQKSVLRTPQQNGVVERRNVYTGGNAGSTMLIF
ncbi:integrase, catalytic region, zinc finger, CCHC-type containing protein [Tanacetum coccineum]|uniref:Integrase, catalytic region, zinc finger, CCHC-type containing protein n=1 Tax=Tanacetum coccineum TaxID=301880 RepID=A0ABQ5AQU2_9ASTR